MLVGLPLSARCAAGPAGAHSVTAGQTAARGHCTGSPAPPVLFCRRGAAEEEQSGERPPHHAALPAGGKRRTGARQREAEPGGGRTAGASVLPPAWSRRHGSVLGERPGAGPGRAGGGPGVP